MPRFFVMSDQISDGVITITGDDAHHITRVLRLRAGDNIVICDMRRNEYDCILEGFGERVGARIVSSRSINTEPPYLARLYQALPKGDKLEVIIQKAVECGAAAIIPFESERCVARVRLEAEEGRTERRRRVAREAAGQSGRGKIPEVSPTLGFDAMLRLARDSDLTLFCYEGEVGLTLPRVLSEAGLERAGNPAISLIIGPEGGFSRSEVSRAAASGARLCSLGSRILRTETAGSFALACLACEMELK